MFGSRIISACAIKPMSSSLDVKSRSLENLLRLQKLFRIERATAVLILTFCPAATIAILIPLDLSIHVDCAGKKLVLC
jgi:hypothetical protein